MFSRIEKLFTIVAIYNGMLLAEVVQWGHLNWEKLALPWHPQCSLSVAAFLAPLALLIFTVGTAIIISIFIALLKGMKSEFVALVHTPKERKGQLAANFGLCTWIMKTLMVWGGAPVAEAWSMSLIAVGSCMMLIFVVLSAYRAWHQNKQPAN